MKIVNRNPVAVVFQKESAEFIVQFILAAQEDGWRLSTWPNENGLSFNMDKEGIQVDFCNVQYDGSTVEFKEDLYRTQAEKEIGNGSLYSRC